MTTNATSAPATEHGHAGPPCRRSAPVAANSDRTPWRAPLPSPADRAAAIYSIIPLEVREKLPSAKHRADMRRARSSDTTSTPLARLIEQIEDLRRAGEPGAFVEATCALLRMAAIDTDPLQTDLPFTLRDAMLEAERADLAEDLIEIEARAANYEDPTLNRRLYDAKARQNFAELRVMPLLKQGGAR